MFPTLQNILDRLHSLNTEPEILSGHDSLNDAVRWLHVSEQPDVAGFLRGGELILSTGLTWAQTAASVKDYLSSLKQVGSSGLLLRLEPQGNLPVGEIARAAQELEFPVIRLHRRIAFVEFTQAIHSEIINQQANALDVLEEVEFQVARILETAGGHDELLGYLAVRLQSTLIVEDLNHRIADFVSFSGDKRPSYREWQPHARMSHPIFEGNDFVGSLGVASRREVQLLGGVCAANNETKCFWAPIYMDGLLWGRLHLIPDLHAHRNLPQASDITRSIVEQVAYGISISASLISDVEKGSQSESRIEEIMSWLLAGKKVGVQALNRVFAPLRNADRSTRVLALAFRSEHVMSKPDEDIRLFLEQSSLGVIVGKAGSKTLYISLVTLEFSLTELENLVAQVAQTTVALSDVRPVEELLEVVSQASTALDIGTQMLPNRSLVRFQDLGVYRLLWAMHSRGQLSHFVESQLGPLFKYDAVQGKSLIETLRVFVGNGNKVSPTAEVLGIDRRTLLRRIELVKQLTGVDFDAYRDNIYLNVAILGMELMETPN